jgi:hypothetical protein
VDFIVTKMNLGILKIYIYNLLANCFREILQYKIIAKSFYIKLY